MNGVFALQYKQNMLPVAAQWTTHGADGPSHHQRHQRKTMSTRQTCLEKRSSLRM